MYLVYVWKESAFAAWLSTWSDDQWPPDSSVCTHHPERGREYRRDRKTKNVAHKKMLAPPGRASATRPRLRHPAAPPPPGCASATRPRLFRIEVTLHKSMASEFLIAWSTFCAGISCMLVRLCLIMILNTFCFIMQ